MFKQIQEFGLKLHPHKCNLGCSKVFYLGIFPDPEKLRAVDCFPVPTPVKSLHGFLGLAGYYCRFVPRFSKIATPLYLLLWPNVQFHWTEECRISFDCLKTRLTSPPVLSYPDFSKHSVVTLMLVVKG